MKYVLRPRCFGSQIDGILKILREGCAEHGQSLAGVPECRDCRVIKCWRPELGRPTTGSISTPTGYMARPAT